MCVYRLCNVAYLVTYKQLKAETLNLQHIEKMHKRNTQYCAA